MWPQWWNVCYVWCPLQECLSTLTKSLESRLNKAESLTKIVPVGVRSKPAEPDARRIAAAVSFPGTCTVSDYQPPLIIRAATITTSDLKVSLMRASYIKVNQITGSFEITPWWRKKLCLREPVQLISAHCVKWHRANFTSFLVQNNSNLKKKSNKWH